MEDAATLGSQEVNSNEDLEGKIVLMMGPEATMQFFTFLY